MLDQMYGVNESIPAAYNVVVTVTVLQLIFVLCVCCLAVQVTVLILRFIYFFPINHHVMSTHSLIVSFDEECRGKTLSF